MYRSIFMLCGLVGLAGCDYIPRGAGLQSEILSETQNRPEGAPPEFAVEVVTQQNLTTFVQWPSVDGRNLSWIDRVDQPDNRTIAAGDTLSITIWTSEENGLLTTAGQRSVTFPATRVSSSGTVFLPYVGDVRIRDMSPERARLRIEESYQPVSASAQVQLAVTEGRDRTVSLVSGVSSPGSYPLPNNDYTLLELVADGGGVSASLNNPQVRLQRNGQIYGTSVDRLLDSPRMNTTLQGGDRVFVEEDERTFMSLGAAGTEAIHKFPTDDVTALEALAIIGGVADARADAGGILILRRYPVRDVTADRSGPDHPRTVFTLDLTSADGLFSADSFALQPGDLVYVTESPVTAISSIFGIIGSTIGFGNQLN